MKKPMLEQKCPLAFVVLAWLLYFGGIIFFALAGQILMAAVWIISAPLLMWAYIRWFPLISGYMGYGSVSDKPAPAAASIPVDVTLYTAIGCPFCPIVKRRLGDLESRMGFRLADVDVTARPDLLIRKGIWSVPVVEVGERRIVGNATSDQLAGLIAGTRLRVA